MHLLIGLLKTSRLSGAALEQAQPTLSTLARNNDRALKWDVPQNKEIRKDRRGKRENSRWTMQNKTMHYSLGLWPGFAARLAFSKARLHDETMTLLNTLLGTTIHHNRGRNKRLAYGTIWIGRVSAQWRGPIRQVPAVTSPGRQLRRAAAPPGISRADFLNLGEFVFFFLLAGVYHFRHAGNRWISRAHEHVTCWVPRRFTGRCRYGMCWVQLAIWDINVVVVESWQTSGVVGGGFNKYHVTILLSG